jgi:hypothetical protein
MGGYKRQLEEEQERGWRSVGGKTVCDRHIEEDELADLVRATATETRCSYCDRSGDKPFAAELDVLIERIATSLPYEWGNADDEGVAWDGGYAAETYDSWDLVADYYALLNHGELIADVVRALPEHAWVQRDFYRLRPHERLVFGWEHFGAIVKHRRRYFFADGDPDDLDVDDPDYVSPGAMLAGIGTAVRRASLVRRLDEGVVVYRVRAHAADEHPTDAASLGAPPASAVKSSGRMNPAGVPLFYEALDPDTAISEARDTNPNAEAFTLGEFTLRHPVYVVDLATLPQVPSLFDADRRELRPATLFLREFATSVSEPFVRDDRIHIEYVPTQIVTEWLKTRFYPGAGREVLGVLYGSARRIQGENVALFIDNDGGCDPPSDADDPALLVLRSHRRL